MEVSVAEIENVLGTKLCVKTFSKHFAKNCCSLLQSNNNSIVEKLWNLRINDFSWQHGYNDRQYVRALVIHGQRKLLAEFFDTLTFGKKNNMHYFLMDLITLVIRTRKNKMLSFLWKCIRPKKEDVKKYAFLWLRIACNHGDLKTTKFLIARHCVSDDVLQTRNWYCLRMVFEKKYFPLAVALCALPNVSNAFVTANNGHVLRTAFACKNKLFYAFLEQRYDISFAVYYLFEMGNFAILKSILLTIHKPKLALKMIDTAEHFDLDIQCFREALIEGASRNGCHIILREYLVPFFEKYSDQLLIRCFFNAIAFKRYVILKILCDAYPQRLKYILSHLLSEELARVTDFMDTHIISILEMHQIRPYNLQVSASKQPCAIKRHLLANHTWIIPQRGNIFFAFGAIFVWLVLLFFATCILK